MNRQRLQRLGFVAVREPGADPAQGGAGLGGIDARLYEVVPLSELRNLRAAPGLHIQSFVSGHPAGERLFLQVRVLADSRDRLPAPREILRPFCPLRGDHLLHLAVQQDRRHAALLLDVPKDVPCFSGQLVGQRLDVVGTGGGIEDSADVTLLGQDRLRVARQAAGQFVGLAQHRIEGNRGDGVRSAADGGEGLGRHTQPC